MSDMNIRILGTESLGVRGLSCVVEVKNRKILIDPGIALGYHRYGLLPHPVQVGVGEIIRQKIIDELRDATDVVFSHFHGDHIPLGEANPYQLSTTQIQDLSDDVRIWAKGSQGLSPQMDRRVKNLVFSLNKSIIDAEGQSDDVISFSHGVPHGEEDSPAGEVMLTRIASGKNVFVHASDIQFLSTRAISAILEFKPDIVLASGPPIYLSGFSKEKKEFACNNIMKLSQQVETLIIDHHLLRCQEGMICLKSLDKQSENRYARSYTKISRFLMDGTKIMLRVLKGPSP